jgi:alpha-glucosidase
MSRPGIVALLLAITPAVAPRAAAQEGTFTFLGNFRRLDRVAGGVTVSAENGAVRIEQVAGVGFRVRYAFGGGFDTTASWATIPDSVVLAEPRVRETSQAVTVTGGALVATIAKRPVRLTVADTAGHELFAESFGAGHLGRRVTHVVARPPEAHYFGFGEQADSLDRTGDVLTLWNTDAYGYRTGSNPLYASIPFYVALRRGRAYGVFYDNPWRSQFDVGAALKGNVGFTAVGGELRFYVFPGPSVRSVLAEYTRLTGRAPLPPEWALGYQQSRWGYFPDSELVRVAHEFRSRRIPCDVLYLDIDYMDGYRVFTWSPERFPDPRSLFADLAARGFKVTTIVDPGVKVDSGYDVYRELLARHDYVTWPDGSPYVGEVWPGRVLFPDFSLASTRSWWGDLHRRLLGVGVAGIWNDMNEPANFGGRTLPVIAAFDHGAGSHLEYHNLYALLEARATYEGWRRIQPDRRPFIVTRAGFAGLQRYTSIWTGDNTANWEHAGLAIPMVLGLGISGVPFAGADIGGFGGSPDGELFSRFLEIGAFLPFFRTHSDFASQRREPWAFGPVYEAANREMIRLRYRLLPHLYTAFYRHTQDGSPVVRPLLWDHQGDTTTYGVNDEFTFGDHLLVAPVTREGRDARTVYLPAGRWYRYSSDQAFEGGRTITVSAPRVNPNARDDSDFVRGVPLFVEAGAVIPMQAVEQYVGERRMDTLDLHVWDGGSVTSELYEDAGEGFAYRQGAFRLTTFRTTSDGAGLGIALAQTGRYEGAATVFSVVVHGLAGAPKAVTVDGRVVQAGYDGVRKLVAFDVPATTREIRIER